jgi:hypothetical protein
LSLIGEVEINTQWNEISSLFAFLACVNYLISMDSELFFNLLCQENLSTNPHGWRSPDSVWANVAIRMNMANNDVVRKMLYSRWQQNWKGVREKMLTKDKVSAKPANQ